MKEIEKFKHVDGSKLRSGGYDMPRGGVWWEFLKIWFVHRGWWERGVVDFGQNVVGSHHAENSVEGDGLVRCIFSVCVMITFIFGDLKKCTWE